MPRGVYPRAWQEAAMRAADWVARGQSVARASRRFRVGRKAILTACRLRGIRSPYARRTPRDVREAVLSQLAAGTLRVCEAARALHVAPSTICAWRHRAHRAQRVSPV